MSIKDSHYSTTTRCHKIQCQTFVQGVENGLIFDTVTCNLDDACPSDSPFIELNGGCVSECAKGEVYIIYTSDNRVYRKCQKKCSADWFTYLNEKISSVTKQCAQRCPRGLNGEPDMPYISGNDCLASCDPLAQ